jgi:hypothetical protein
MENFVFKMSGSTKDEKKPVEPKQAKAIDAESPNLIEP